MKRFHIVPRAPDPELVTRDGVDFYTKQGAREISKDSFCFGFALGCMSAAVFLVTLYFILSTIYVELGGPRQ